METHKSDLAAAFGKGIAGGIPFFGALIAEIVGATIPNQRIDRIESLLKMLEAKINEEDRDKAHEQLKKPESIDLLEDGFIQGSRALSEERKEYIAALLKNSLTDDELRHIEYKRLLSLLGELSDPEIIILMSHTFYSGPNEFREKYKHILSPEPSHLGAPRNVIDRSIIYQSNKSHLVRLGLLKMRFPRVKKGEAPEFDDKTGMVKAQGYEITPLGRLLLRTIDFEGEF